MEQNEGDSLEERLLKVGEISLVWLEGKESVKNANDVDGGKFRTFVGTLLFLKKISQVLGHLVLCSLLLAVRFFSAQIFHHNSL